MSNLIAYRNLSVFVSIIVILYLIVATISPHVWYGTPYIAASFFIATLLILWPFRPYDDFYWRQTEPAASINPALALIFSIIFVQLILTSSIELIAHEGGIQSTIIYYFSWGFIPALFIAKKWILIPKKTGSPSLLLSATIAILSTAFCAAISGLIFVFIDRLSVPSVYNFVFELLDTISAAFLEEIVFRLILLTALIELSKSRLAALIISSSLFAILHVPVLMSGMIINGEWGNLAAYSRDLFPAMNHLLGMGFILGAVWLRTGSLILVVFLHTILNLGVFLSREWNRIAP